MKNMDFLEFTQTLCNIFDIHTAKNESIAYVDSYEYAQHRFALKGSDRSYLQEIAEYLTASNLKFIQNTTGGDLRSIELTFEDKYQTCKEKVFRLLNLYVVISSGIHNQFQYQIPSDNHFNLSEKNIIYIIAPQTALLLSNLEEYCLPKHSLLVLIKSYLLELNRNISESNFDSKSVYKEILYEQVNCLIKKYEEKYHRKFLKKNISILSAIHSLKRPLKTRSIKKHIIDLVSVIQAEYDWKGPLEKDLVQDLEFIFASLYCVSILMRFENRIDNQDLFIDFIKNVSMYIEVNGFSKKTASYCPDTFISKCNKNPDAYFVYHSHAMIYESFNGLCLLETRKVTQLIHNLKEGNIEKNSRYLMMIKRYYNRHPIEFSLNLRSFLDDGLRGCGSLSELKEVKQELEQLSGTVIYREVVLNFIYTLIAISESDKKKAIECISIAYDKRNCWPIGKLKAHIIELYFGLKLSLGLLTRKYGYDKIMLEYIACTSATIDDLNSGNGQAEFILPIIHTLVEDPKSYLEKEVDGLFYNDIRKMLNYNFADFSKMYFLLLIRRFNNFCVDFSSSFEDLVINPLKPIDNLLGKYFAKLQASLESKLGKKFDTLYECLEEIQITDIRAAFQGLTHTEVVNAKIKHTGFNASTFLKYTASVVHTFIPEKNVDPEFNHAQYNFSEEEIYKRLIPNLFLLELSPVSFQQTISKIFEEIESKE